MALAMLAVAALLAGFLAHRGSAAERERDQVAQEVATGKVGRMEPRPGGGRAAAFAYQDFACRVWYAAGDAGDETRLELSWSEGLPGGDRLRLMRRGPSRLGDLGEKPAALPTADKDFDLRFRFEGDPGAGGVIYRWMDAGTRSLVRELAERQGGGSPEPILALDATGRTLSTWVAGRARSEIDLDPALEILARLARRLTGRPAWEGAAGPVEV